jgi:hypothetical protein
MRCQIPVWALAVFLLVLLPSTPARAATPRAPVVMVMFDELPITSLLARNGSIDRIRYPNFARLAADATWYVNATTTADLTQLAIPSALSGRIARRDAAPSARSHPVNLFTLLKRRGYGLRVGEESTSLCPYRGCRRRYGPHYYLAHDRVARFRAWVRSIRSTRQPVLYYKHTLFPHIPWIFLPTGQRYAHTVLGPISGLNSSEISVFDRTLVNQSWQRHLLQAGAADKLVGELIDRLKQTGMYRRAMVVVMADHGVSFRMGSTDRRTISPATARDIAPIPLIVKDPGQTRARRSHGLVRTYDILPTIAAEIGLKLPRGLNGRVASSAPVRRRGRIKVMSRSARVGEVTLSRGRVLAMKREALRRQVGLFGSGSRTLYHFGPNRSLRGKFVHRLRVVGGGGLRASLNDTRDLVDVRPGAFFVPAFLTGRITGGGRSGRRNIAVAVNGVIAGVTRSAHLRGRPGEYYSVLIDPRSLAAGRNEVQVFVVLRAGGRILLQRIHGRPYRPPAVRRP